MILGSRIGRSLLWSRRPILFYRFTKRSAHWRHESIPSPCLGEGDAYFDYYRKPKTLQDSTSLTVESLFSVLSAIAANDVKRRRMPGGAGPGWGGLPGLVSLLVVQRFVQQHLDHSLVADAFLAGQLVSLLNVGSSEPDVD
jgi:hypothetical protein